MAPAGVAAYLVAGKQDLIPVTMLVAQVDRELAPGTGTAGDVGAPGRGARLLMGVLSSTGETNVDWNGQRITVNDGSYAYVGGESVQTGSRAMAILDLGQGNRVTVCPGSELIVSSGGVDRSPQIEVSGGGARIEFSRDTPFRILASDMILKPLHRGETTSQGQPTIPDSIMVTEVVVDSSGVSICEFSGGLSYVSGGAELSATGSGPIVSSKGEEGRALRRMQMSRDMPGAGAASKAVGGTERQPCSCGELEKLARGQGQPPGAVARADEVTSGAQATTSGPASQVPAVGPPATPPADMLAIPGAPSLLDLDALAPPAAGPDSPGGTTDAGSILAAAPVAPSLVAGGSVLGSQE